MSLCHIGRWRFNTLHPIAAKCTREISCPSHPIAAKCICTLLPLFSWSLPFLALGLLCVTGSQLKHNQLRCPIGTSLTNTFEVCLPIVVAQHSLILHTTCFIVYILSYTWNIPSLKLPFLVYIYRYTVDVLSTVVAYQNSLASLMTFE